MAPALDCKRKHAVESLEMYALNASRMNDRERLRSIEIIAEFVEFLRRIDEIVRREVP